MLNKYSGFLDVLEKIIKIVEIVLLGGITILMGIQCVMRYIFSHALPWCEELCLYMCIFSVFIGISIAIRRESNLQVDFLLSFMKPRTQHLLTAISSIIAIIFMLIFCYYSINLMQHATGASTTLPLHMRDIYFAFPLGSVLLILFSIENIGLNIRKFRHGEEENG